MRFTREYVQDIILEAADTLLKGDVSDPDNLMSLLTELVEVAEEQDEDRHTLGQAYSAELAHREMCAHCGKGLPCEIADELAHDVDIDLEALCREYEEATINAQVNLH